MLIGDVRPTTLDGVKSLATQLRKACGIKHSVALDLAARAADCRDFRHARRTLPARRRVSAEPYVLLTYYWLDTKQRYARGRETLRIALSRPILDICDKSTLKQARSFGDLRMVADDHFVCDSLAPSQRSARKWLLSAERSLRFIERSGLLPKRDYRKNMPDGRFDRRLPDQDHATGWVDQKSGQFILFDEPYSGVPNENERAAWERETGWRVVKTSWPGMYNPYACDLYVVTDPRSGYDIDALVARINAMPPPTTDHDWSGQSADSWETYLSPMVRTDQDRRRARSRATVFPVASATTLPFSHTPGSTRRRPAGELGVNGHIMAGRIIKGVLQSPARPWTVYKRLNSVRATLEDWLALEIGRTALNGPEFFEVYYTSAPGDAEMEARAATSSGMLAMLCELKDALIAAYPDCAPLRSQLGHIDAALKSIARLG
jgi:hypothetical protein